MDKKLAHDASTSISGIIYQYYLAVEWCFSLSSNQSLFIEKDGDLAIPNEANIEVKHFADPLTDAHKNIWNTLANWLDPKFDIVKYPKLILLTTQAIGVNSKLINWKDKNLEERLEVIDEILSRKSLNDKQKKVLSYRQDNRFKEIISKFEIYDSSSVLDEKYHFLTNQYGKGVPPTNRGRLLNGMIGWFISPNVIVENQWEITEKDFSDEFALLNDKFSQNTRHFPRKPTSDDFIVKSSPNSLYLQKIRDIDYLTELDQAHSNYCEALTVVKDEFQHGTRQEYFDDYQGEVIEVFKRRYKRASREVSSPILESQYFYDDILGEEGPEFETYSKRPYRWFRDGVLHVNMNDSSAKLKWKLK